MKKEWKRNCPNPDCNKVIVYKRKRNYLIAIKNNTFCNGCSRMGQKRTEEQRKNISIGTKKAMEIPENKEKHLIATRKGNKKRKKSLKKYYLSDKFDPIKFSLEVKNGISKMSEDAKKQQRMKLRDLCLGKTYEEIHGKEKAKEIKEKQSKSLSGKNNPFYRKKHKPEVIELLREKSTIQRAKELKLAYGQGWANYNKNACEYFDWLNMYMGWNGQHALNGGEKIVSGYSLDYFEPNLNMVIEWDEEYHYDDNKLREKDIRRQQKIMDKLNCDFYRIRGKMMKINKMKGCLYE